jgi:hypothetical protein
MLTSDKTRALAHYLPMAEAAKAEAAPSKPTHPPQVAAWLTKLPADALLGEAQALARELALLKGHGHTPQAGCAFTTLPMGDAEMLVEYEYEAGEAAKLYGPPEDCYEGSPESLTIVQVLINGMWCDPSDFVSDKQIERWEQAILDGIAEDIEDARISAYESAREYA